MKVVKHRIIVTVVLLLFLLAGPGRYVYGEEEESSIPVHFLENREISLDLYPEGYRSAAVLTGTGIDGEKNLNPLKRLIFLLANKGIRGTFFVSPGEAFRKNVAPNRELVELLSQLSSNDFEIAQNGSTLFPEPGREKEPENGSGPSLAPFGQRIDEIKESRRLLVSLGLEPKGYRGYEPSPAAAVLPFLDKMGYLYFCGIDDRAASGAPARSDPSPSTVSDYVYPEHTAGVQILKFYALLNPTVEPEKSRQLFEEITRRSGVFIYQIYLPGLLEKTKLNKLNRFIEYLKKQNTWICSLQALSSWWNAREKVEVETILDDNFLVIVYNNPTRFPLKNARLVFKDRKSSARYYRVEDRRGIMTSQGMIPDCGYVNVTLFSVESGENNVMEIARPELKGE